MTSTQHDRQAVPAQEGRGQRGRVPGALLPPSARAVLRTCSTSLTDEVAGRQTTRQAHSPTGTRVRAAVLVLPVTSLLVLLGQPGWAGEDPCGGTGGVGHVVRVDKDAFTIRRRDGATARVTKSSTSLAVP